jgi:3-oxoacyl-[acyl-carrier protein] reductase
MPRPPHDGGRRRSGTDGAAPFPVDAAGRPAYTGRQPDDPADCRARIAGSSNDQPSEEASMATPVPSLSFKGLVIPDIAGRAVLITGGSSGIGRSIALGFAAAGAKVVIHYQTSVAGAERTAEEIRAGGGEAALVHFDAADSAAVARGVAEAVTAFGRLDGLVNNAGSMMGRSPYETTDLDHLDHVFQVNGRSVLAATQAALPALKDAKGFVINTTSIAARNGGSLGAGLYASAKGYVATMTKGMAKEFAPYGIRVNAVAPGVIMTPFHERDSTPAQLEASRQTIPMARLGGPDECVGAYLFLASPLLSGYVTGQTIEVNGGQLMP